MTLSRSPCASATPCSASLTTSAGSLMSFFIFQASCALLSFRLVLRGNGPPDRRAAGDPSRLRLLDLAGRVLWGRPASGDLLHLAGGGGLQPRVQDVADEEVVEEHTDDAADERTDYRYPEVIAEV